MMMATTQQQQLQQQQQLALAGAAAAVAAHVNAGGVLLPAPNATATMMGSLYGDAYGNPVPDTTSWYQASAGGGLHLATTATGQWGSGGGNTGITSSSAPDLTSLQGVARHVSYDGLGAIGGSARPHSFTAAVPPGQCVAPGQQQQQQLLPELAAALAAQQPGTPSRAESQQLEALEQLQALIAQQQLQLQLQQQAFGLAATANAAAAAAGGRAYAVAARASAPGCFFGSASAAAGQNDTDCSRDQLFRDAAAVASAAQHIKSGALGFDLLSAALYSQQQQQQQQGVVSPCSMLGDTPTALAALPPGLLADVVGFDAAASAMPQQQQQHWAYGVNNRRTSNRINQLANLQISSRAARSSSSSGGTSSATAASAAADGSSTTLAHSNGSRGWDWASVGELLRTDSTASRSSINRSSSSIPCEGSANSSNIWADVSAALGPPPSLLLPPCGGAAAGGAQQAGLVGLQRTTSNASGNSHHSACATPMRTAPAAAGAHAAASAAAIDALTLAAPAAAAAVAAALAAGAAASSGRQASAASRSSTGRQQAGGQQQAHMDVDNLLKSCAPKWAKAGWNPKASVAVAPAAAPKGTGAFVRFNSGATSGTSAASQAAGSSRSSSDGARKGTGAFIPPAVHAAVAATSGLQGSK